MSPQSTGYDTPLIRDTLVDMKLSVIVITYNHERFIAKAIESVLAQRVNFDYEIVVGEDCSTDGTRAVIMDFHRRYPGRIVPQIRDHNVGGSRNTELSVAACRGQYLALLEGDDYWTREDKLQRQVDFLDANPDFAICCHRVNVVDETVAQAGTFPPRAAGSYTLDDLLRDNFIMTCTTVFRRDDLPPLPARMHNLSPLDWARFAMIAKHGKIALMDEIMAAYRVHSGGTWTPRMQADRLHESIRMLKALDKELGVRYSGTIRRTIAEFYCTSATTLRSLGKRFETAKDLLGCLRNGGWRLPGSRRTLAALGAYALIGSWYKVFLKSKSTTDLKTYSH